MSGHWGGLLWWCQQRLDALLQCVQVGQGLPELLLLRLWVVRVDPRWHGGRLLVPACWGIRVKMTRGGVWGGERWGCWRTR